MRGRQPPALSLSRPGAITIRGIVMLLPPTNPRATRERAQKDIAHFERLLAGDGLTSADQAHAQRQLEVARLRFALAERDEHEATLAGARYE
jgi:hypothetical protein